MRAGHQTWLALVLLAGLAAADVTADLALVQAYVAAHANDTFRPPNGSLTYPYLVPAGPYDQLWYCSEPRKHRGRASHMRRMPGTGTVCFWAWLFWGTAAPGT